MSEPVGNSPRSMEPIVPGNSHKQREIQKQEAAVEERPTLEKIVEGKVVQRKQPWYRRWAGTLIADDASSVREWVMTEVVIPSIRNFIADTIKGSTDRIFYGGPRARGVGRIGERGSLRTRYDLMSDPGERPRQLSREDRARHHFDAVVLSSHQEGVEVIEALIEQIAKYRSASVADLYDLLGVTGSYADRRWGWTDLRNADVRPVRDGFLLDLPQPISLR